MTFVHSLSPSRTSDQVHDGDHRSLGVHKSITSTDNCVPLQELTERQISVERLFAAYQPINRPPYDLNNRFDRTNLALIIRRYIDRCEDYIALARAMHSDGRMTDIEFALGAGQRMADLREHRNALFRLNEYGRN